MKMPEIDDETVQEYRDELETVIVPAKKFETGHSTLHIPAENGVEPFCGTAKQKEGVGWQEKNIAVYRGHKSLCKRCVAHADDSNDFAHYSMDDIKEAVERAYELADDRLTFSCKRYNKHRRSSDPAATTIADRFDGSWVTVREELLE